MAAGAEHWLSDIRGRRIVAADGTALGRVVDLAIASGPGRPQVVELLFRRRRGPLLRAPWGAVSMPGHGPLGLRPGTSMGAGSTPPQVPRLVRDVLDAQVVDIDGRRLRRVSDVRLREVEGELLVIGVDTGWRTLLRRLLGRHGDAGGEALLDWSTVHLARAGQRTATLGAGAEDLAMLSPSGLSELIAQLPRGHGAEVLEAVPPADAAEALTLARPRLGGRMIASLAADRASEILAAMPVDDAVAVMRHVEAGCGAQLLEQLPTQRAAELRRLLELPAHTAGGLMTTDVRTASEDEPAENVRARLAADPPRLEGLATVFVIDADGRYTGALTPTALLTGGSPRRLPSLRIDTPVDDVIDVFAIDDVLALPVLDEQDHLVGAVAIDDILEELLAERLPQNRPRYRRVIARGRRRS